MKAWIAKSEHGMFATRTLAGHLLRGAIAFTLLWWALRHQHTHTATSLLAAAGAMWAMRGCPICWAIGLAETLQQRFTSRPVPPSPAGTDSPTPP